MIDSLAVLGWVAVAAALAGSHRLAFRIGHARALAAAPQPEPAPPAPVLVIDNDGPAQEALQALDADFAAVPAYAQTLIRQIDGVKSDTEAGIALVIDEVDAINGQAREQIARMHASLDGCEALARSSERPRAIIGSLQSTLDRRTAQIRANFDSLGELAHEFDTLRPIIETISTIADKAFFLSINAAVEAARAGASGAAFGLVAEEVRALSKLTQTASKEMGAGIVTFTRRMHDELDRARPQVEGSSGELDLLIGELGEIQSNLATAGGELSDMIHAMDGGHRQMVERLSSILGHVQFQDVIRQRLDQVGDAINDLADHIGDNMASARAGDVQALLSLDERLIAQQSSYVMQSQRAVLASVAGGAVCYADAAPSIELF